MRKINFGANGVLRAAFALCASMLLTRQACAASGSIGIDSDGWDKPWTTSVTVNRGQEHTFWVTGLTEETSVASLDVEGTYKYKDEDGEVWEDWITPGEWTETYDANYNVSGIYVLLTADDWEYVPDSIKAVKFTVTVEGSYDEENKKNNNFTFNHAAGRDSYPAETEYEPVVVIPTGAQSNPKVLSATETSTPTNIATCGGLSASVLSDYENRYYIKASLKTGRKYFFGYASESPSVWLSASLSGSASQISETAKTYTNHWTTCSEAYEFVPETDGTYEFVLTGAGSESFTFYLAVMPTRTPAGHNPTRMAAGDVSGSFTPGYLNDPENGYYDEIIDQQLFEVTGFTAKSNYVFRTFGASVPIMMCLYNANGEVIARNYYESENGYDARIAWTAPASASSSRYFVGVCQDAPEDGQLQNAAAMTLSVESVALADPQTDVKVIATSLIDNSPFEVPGALACASRTLGANEWANTYVIEGGRVGVNYHVKTRLADGGADNGLRIKAYVYQIDSSKKEAEVSYGGGDIDPSDETAYLEFTPAMNGPVYIRVFVDDGNWGKGQGLDYGPYELAVVAAGEYGVLSVDMLGEPADKMQWMLKKFNGSSMTGEVYYNPGAGTILPAGQYEIAAKPAVSGFATPTNRFVTVETEKERTTLFKYDDTIDKLASHVDDYPAGKSGTTTYKATAILPTAKGVSVSRSLFKEGSYVKATDIADWFSFTAVKGQYYKFAFNEKDGADTDTTPVVRVFSSADEENECAYTLMANEASAVQILAAAAGTHYVKVSHANPENPVDSSYTLTAYKYDVGQIRLSSAAVTVNEGQQYVDVKVSRTASDGIARVKYATQAGTAKPGENYYPDNGVITWANGDKSIKTIRINLIPSLYAAWNENKQFTVKFSVFGEDEIDPENEHIPAFAIDTKTQKPVDECVVTIKEISKKVPGTIQVANCDNPKKPVFTVVAGDKVEIELERVIGTNGLVGVVVSTAKGTANKSGETDFTSIANVTNSWENGVWGVCPDKIVIQTKPVSNDFTVTKTFTVKLAAIRTNTKTQKVGGETVRVDPIDWDTPTLAASSITVNILNDKYADSLPNYAKTLPKTEGVAVKESKSGTWFEGEDGGLYSVNAIKFKGPGRVIWGPTNEPNQNVTYIPAAGATISLRTDAVYEHQLLPLATNAAPTVDKAVVAAGENRLYFNRAEGDEALGIGYRAYVMNKAERGKSAASGGKKTIVLGDAETALDVRIDESGRAYVETNLVEKLTYSWRVDSCYTNAEGAVMLAATNKTPWTVSVIADGSHSTAVRQTAPEEVEDVSNSTGLISLRRGIYAQFKMVEGVTGTVTKVTGSYPNGMSLRQVKPDPKDVGTWYWELYGTPTKGGVYNVLLQAKFTEGKTTVPATTAALAFEVTDIPAAVPLAPTVNKAVLTPGNVKLLFTKEADVSYRVFFADPKSKSKLGKDETEVFEPYEVEIGPGTNYSWQVFSFFEEGTQTNKTAQFSLTGAAEDAAVTRVRGTSAYPYNEEFDFDGVDQEGRTVRLKQRLAAKFEIADETATAVKVVSGTLPTGLKIAQDKYNAKTNPEGKGQWFLSGTPTKAGTFTVLLQATFQVERKVMKNGKETVSKVSVPAATTEATFVVEEVDTVPGIVYTLTGPGRFTYTGLDFLDREVKGTNYLASGSKSVTLADIKDVVSYEYVQLPKVTPLAPLVDKAVVKPGSDVEFRFSKSAIEDVKYRVYALSSGASWMKPPASGKGNPVKTNYKLGDADTEVQPDGEDVYSTNAVYDAVNKGKYTWRVDSYFEGGSVTNSSATFSFTAAVTNASCSAEQLAETRVTGVDVLGNGIDFTGTDFTANAKVVLRRLVKAELAVGEIGSTVTKVAGTIPTGLTLKQVTLADKSKRYYIAGTPTKAGEFQVVLQEKKAYPSGKATTSVAGTTTVIDFVVDDASMAQGTFTGLAKTWDVDDGLRALASVTLTAPSTGKLSASVKIGGKTYAFTDTGYSYMSVDGSGTNVTAVLSQVQTIGSGNTKVVSTNVLYCTVTDNCESNAANWRVEGVFSMHFPHLGYATGTNRTAEVWYEGKLCRDNSKYNTGKANDAFVAEVAGFAGYYTVALANLNALPGEPRGNGYITMTLDAKGKAKFTGYLADGTAYSASSVAACLVGEGADEKLRLPLYVCSTTSSKPYVFGGWLEFRFREVEEANGAGTSKVKVPVVFCNSPDTDLFWANDNSLSTRDGEYGYQIALYPSGGWYDTVKNLQAWYLYYDMSVSMPDATDDLAELAETLPEGYDFAVKALPGGQTVDVVGDKVSVAAQKLVKGADKLNDWGISTNAANVKVNFTRATGVVSGTFDLWYDGNNTKGDWEQVNSLYKGLKHYGLFIPYRWDDGILEEEVWTTGFFLAQQKIKYYDEKAKKEQTRSWTGSYRFDIRAEKAKRDWSEVQQGEDNGGGGE